jgi:hypothetical protein
MAEMPMASGLEGLSGGREVDAHVVYDWRGLRINLL